MLMDVAHIDHVNLYVPEDGVETATDFYADRLGFETEGTDAFESGEKPFFAIRLTPEHVIHLWPTSEFDPPDGAGFNHVALVVAASIDEIEAALEEAGVDVAERLDAPRGATGESPAVYVRDPFGYQIELKAATDR